MIISLLVIWLVCALIRCKVFQKMGLTPWYSIIPFWGTFLLFKKTWSLTWYWLYVLSLVFMALVYTVDITGYTAMFLIYVCCFCIAVGWTGINFYLGKSFNINPLFGLGLALLYPVFLLILAFGKAECNLISKSEC